VLLVIKQLEFGTKTKIFGSVKDFEVNQSTVNP